MSVEEQYAERLAQIHKATTPQALVRAYGKLKEIFSLFSKLEILDYDLRADQYFQMKHVHFFP